MNDTKGSKLQPEPKPTDYIKYSMTRLLRQSAWWPGINSSIKEYCNSCKGCSSAETRNCPPPKIERETSISSWIDISADFKGPVQGGNISMSWSIMKFMHTTTPWAKWKSRTFYVTAKQNTSCCYHQEKAPQKGGQWSIDELSQHTVVKCMKSTQ